jgi:hypothetical protein
MSKFCELWQYISSSKEQIGLILTLIGLNIAWFGVRNWKKQLDGTSKVKLSKSLLSKVYHIRDLFRHARISAFFENEFPVEPNLQEKAKAIYILNNRIRPLQQKMSEFEDEFYQAYVEWGDSASKYLKGLRKVYYDYLYSRDYYLEYFDLEKEFQDENYNKAYSTIFDSNENDLFEDRLSSVVKELDDFFRPKYMGFIRYRLWKLRNYATQ